MCKKAHRGAQYPGGLGDSRIGPKPAPVTGRNDGRKIRDSRESPAKKAAPRICAAGAAVRTGVNVRNSLARSWTGKRVLYQQKPPQPAKCRESPRRPPSHPTPSRGGLWGGAPTEIEVMKTKQPLRRFGVDDTAAPTVTGEFSNRTTIRRTASHVSLVCPVCGTSFTRKAAEAKRHAVSYCGKACFGFACRKQINVKCRVCEKPFTVKASHVGKVTCCGEDCRRKAISECTSAMDVARWKTGVFQGGEKSSMAKLTEAQARAILADQRRHADIAQDYGITRAAVSCLKRGKTWAHLKDNAAITGRLKAQPEGGPG